MVLVEVALCIPPGVRAVTNFGSSLCPTLVFGYVGVKCTKWEMTSKGATLAANTHIPSTFFVAALRTNLIPLTSDFVLYAVWVGKVGHGLGRTCKDICVD